MRNIIVISSFDPISNKNINDILNFNDKNTKFVLFPIYSKNSSIDDRIYMINLALKKYEINYDVNLFLSYKYKEKIDLSKLILLCSLKQPSSEVYVLVNETEPVLLSEEKIIKYKITFDLNNINFDDSYNIRTLKNLDTDDDVIDYIISKNIYFMEIINRYISGHRLIHSISVAKTAYKIAKSNSLSNPDNYFIAGLLHDIGKNIDKDESLNYMEKYFRKYVYMPEYAYHQFVGAFLAKQLFPCVSNDILGAIMMHCTGIDNMNAIQKVIYSSDKIEPTRGYDSEPLINACMKDYNAGFVKVLNENIKFLCKNSGETSNNDLTNRCLMYYLRKK